VNGKVLKEIMGTTCYRGYTIFLVDFDGNDDYVLVYASDLNAAFPQQVIKYYEERIIWSDNPNPNDSNEVDTIL